MKRQGIDWRGHDRKLLFLRGTFGTVSLYLYFLTIAHMPLGTAVTIQYLSPIFTTILALIILKEKVRPVHWLFFMISFSGVFVMRGFSSGIELIWLVAGIISAIGSAFAYITIRSLKQSENPLVVVFHFQLVGSLTGIAFSATSFVMPSGIEWLYLLMLGLFTQLGQMSMTRALQMDKVANVTIINYSGVVYATIAGFLLFGEQYSTGTLAGMALVIAGVVLSVLFRK
jgi:drug/metabolite transporter (DMT)-like permease